MEHLDRLPSPIPTDASQSATAPYVTEAAVPADSTARSGDPNALMMAGRLEFFTVLLLFTPAFWKR